MEPSARLDSQEIQLEELQRFEVLRLYAVITSFSENRIEHDIKKQKNEIIVSLVTNIEPISPESGVDKASQFSANKSDFEYSYFGNHITIRTTLVRNRGRY